VEKPNLLVLWTMQPKDEQSDVVCLQITAPLVRVCTVPKLCASLIRVPTVWYSSETVCVVDSGTTLQVLEKS